jgi:hypothetical protein
MQKHTQERGIMSYVKMKGQKRQHEAVWKNLIMKADNTVGMEQNSTMYPEMCRGDSSRQRKQGSQKLLSLRNRLLRQWARAQKHGYMGNLNRGAKPTLRGRPSIKSTNLVAPRSWRAPRTTTLRMRESFRWLREYILALSMSASKD